MSSFELHYTRDNAEHHLKFREATVRDASPIVMDGRKYVLESDAQELSFLRQNIPELYTEQGLSCAALKEKLLLPGALHRGDEKAQIVNTKAQHVLANSSSTLPQGGPPVDTLGTRSTSSLKAPLSEIVQPGPGAEIDSYVNAIAQNTSFRGACIVVQNGKTILSKGYGMATPTESNTAATVFHIGSITKSFTAVAIMKLVEDKKIDVTKPINQYLPKAYRRTPEWDEITVEQLLAHTSGLSNYTDSDPHEYRGKSKDELIKMAMAEDPPLPYAKKWHYSNTGYLLLGAIIEEQCKPLSYGQFMQKHLFDPAHMNTTGVHEGVFIPTPHMAMGFCSDSSGENLVEDTSENLSESCGADGNMYSSLQDLVIWNHILDNGGSILTPESVKRMKTAVPGADNYGYGLGIEQRDGVTAIFHDGHVPGFNSNFVKYPDKNIFIAVLGNNGGFPAGYISEHIAAYLLGTQQKSVTIVPHNFREDPRIGTFTSTKYSVQLEFYERNGRLFMKGLDGPKTAREVVLLSDGGVFVPNGSLKITFEPFAKLGAEFQKQLLQ